VEATTTSQHGETTSQHGETSLAYVDVLVAQALDDLQETRYPVGFALHRVAHLAWEEGRQHGIRGDEEPGPFAGPPTTD
jgi:hypothetical protein